MNQAVEFDFAARQCRTMPPAEAPGALRGGKCCWLDIDRRDRPATEAILRELGIDALAVAEAFSDDARSRLVTHESCILMRVTTVTAAGAQLRFSRLDLLLTSELLVTLHDEPVEAIDRTWQTYEQDFRSVAKSLSFMLFEVFDRLADGYRRAIRTMETESEEFQSRIFGEVGDEIFSYVGHAHRDLLTLRAALLSVRDILQRLATRKSRHVSEESQPYLGSIVERLESLVDDLAVAREILAESLNLYMSIVSHRTNRVVTRLTVLNVIFLPLTFLCGVYGMNFKYQPEVQWRYGYLAFWIAALSIAGGLLLFMKRRRWL